MEIAKQLMTTIGQELHMDFNIFKDKVDVVLNEEGIQLTAPQKNQILNAVSWHEEKAEKVIKKVHKPNDKKLSELLEKYECKVDQLHDYGYWQSDIKGNFIEYETDTDLRDTENVPLKENIYEYFLREVRPHVDEAWINIDQTKIGYDINFNKYFYKHKSLRSLQDVTKDILDLEAETEGLLKKLVSIGETS